MTPEAFAAKMDANPFSAMREKLMQKVLFVVLAKAQPKTPWRFGTLRRSETTRLEDGGTRGFIGSNVVYAPFVHARVPFFAEAIDESRPEIADILKDIGDEYFGSLE